MGDVVVIAVLAKMSPEELDRCLQQLTELAPLVGDHAHTLEHALAPLRTLRNACAHHPAWAAESANGLVALVDTIMIAAAPPPDADALLLEPDDEPAGAAADDDGARANAESALAATRAAVTRAGAQCLANLAAAAEPARAEIWNELFPHRFSVWLEHAHRADGGDRACLCVSLDRSHARLSPASALKGDVRTLGVLSHRHPPPPRR